MKILSLCHWSFELSCAGDAVALILPMTPWAVACYLGVILAGCVVVSIADSFASEEVATRLRIAKACLVITQDVLVRGGKHLPLYSRVVVGAGAPAALVLPCQAWVLPSTPASPTLVPLRGGDLTWEAFLHPPCQHTQPCQPTAPASSPKHPPAPYQPHLLSSARTQPREPAWPGWLHWAGAGDACNILFSSGTTGEPKAIVWSHTTPLRCAVDGWAHQGIQPGDVCCWPTSLGWMMGPWLVFASLLNGCTLALYNGSPLGRDFGQFASAARVNMLGLVPSIVKAWRHSGCMKGLDWPQLKVISSTGEASSPDDSHWLMALMRYRVPIID
ncbi:hypothetical protein DUNSADRAFT_3483 [Dunaliella salina]|uniref:AMP-dependent synthetase/ligase domain-containing protein n=1 Tax=Dunaliella salina TaxID=3046 RepID=A0ABQ7GTV9_DUNSA|nr:hypothetical protein DUNSADRAFT_3483 [Dunaliella salina]|eukprot:KAF5838049.1 hypothetical protein DUNSADRAFT_3483 [Dunaliella salina]